jgi:hypothetical protein
LTQDVFGGIQILRRHWRWMLPGPETEQNHLSLGQRWAYLCGAVQWYGDLLALLFFVFLLVGAGNVAFSGGLVFRKLTGFLLAAIPMLVVLGLLRAVALLRRGTGATWREAFGAFLIWQSTTLTVALASVQALYAKEAVFLRTPKTQGEHAWTDALRANWAECLLGFVGVVAIAAALARSSSAYGGPLLAVLLVWPTVSFLAAPYNSLSAQRASLPPELRARQRTEHLRYGARRVTYAVGGFGLAGGLAALALGLFAAGPASIVQPQLLGPAKGKPAGYGPSRVTSSKLSASHLNRRSSASHRAASASKTKTAASHPNPGQSSRTTTAPTTTSGGPTSTATSTSTSSTTTPTATSTTPASTSSTPTSATSNTTAGTPTSTTTAP